MRRRTKQFLFLTSLAALLPVSGCGPSQREREQPSPPPLPPFSRRQASEFDPHDPTRQVPEYADFLARLKARPFVPISTLTLAELGTIQGFSGMEVAPAQKQLFLTNLLQLLRAHETGDPGRLRHVLLPDDDETGIGWSIHGERRLAIILAAAGMKPGDIQDSMRRASWEVVQKAWQAMVAEYGLTNWWESVSLAESKVWVHRNPQETPPSPGSDTYGEFAGTGVGPALLTYECNSSEAGDATLAALRLAVKFHQWEKPMIYIFRWRWCSKKGAWLPFDSCIGVVGARLPDPFF